MRALTREEASQWCTDHGVELDGPQLPHPRFLQSEGHDFKIPDDAGRRLVFLMELFRCIPEQEILFWVTEWGVWPSSERMHMFERFRASYGEARGLAEAPAFLFEAAEREDLISFVAFAMLFSWECHVLTAKGDGWLFLNHDERGWIYSKEAVELTAGPGC